MTIYTATVTETMQAHIEADSVEEAELKIAEAKFTVSSTEVTHEDLKENN